MWTILSLHKIYTPHDPCCTTTNHVIFIPKWPWLPWNEHEAWTGEFVCPGMKQEAMLDPHAFNICHTSQNMST